ncbi:hypothetical protein HPP92_008973 [Vanilla planifolia]|uniref:SREBP regulating gene protein n=1 Tax=Vanilla planifolia TaxID=51239 RepID=A0A835V6Y6_VANPL|nr:hypothetical protein HPP92_008973 [Vanilla planifolia]
MTTCNWSWKASLHRPNRAPSHKMGISRRGLLIPDARLLIFSIIAIVGFLQPTSGYVCTALSVDSWTGCCPEVGERFSCQGCNLASRCCNSYEYCVSCCLNPSVTKEDLVVKLKIAKPVTAGTYHSAFDFCIGMCRHNSASVVHENSYASDFHHCHSLKTNISGIREANFQILSGIDIVIGKVGESCNSACMSKGKSCVSNKLSVLNRCEMLEKYMKCKGSCLASIGADQPAEVVDNAPENMDI